LILGSVSFLIAFPCSGVVPYLHHKLNSRIFSFFESVYLWACNHARTRATAKA